MMFMLTTFSLISHAQSSTADSKKQSKSLEERNKEADKESIIRVIFEMRDIIVKYGADAELAINKIDKVKRNDCPAEFAIAVNDLVFYCKRMVRLARESNQLESDAIVNWTVVQSLASTVTSSGHTLMQEAIADEARIKREVAITQDALDDAMRRMNNTATLYGVYKD
jgi:GTP-binding protein EngB required for normal cell division